jgi:hypothetical protein
MEIRPPSTGHRATFGLEPSRHLERALEQFASMDAQLWIPRVLAQATFAIHGRVRPSADPLTISVGHPTRLALDKASNGPAANEVRLSRVRSIPQASRLVHGLISTWSGVTDARRCR